MGAYILAPDVETARVRAYDAAQLAMRHQGLDLAPADLVITCRPTPSSCLQPGSTVEVRIDIQVGLPLRRRASASRPRGLMNLAGNVQDGPMLHGRRRSLRKSLSAAGTTSSDRANRPPHPMDRRHQRGFRGLAMG